MKRSAVAWLACPLCARNLAFSGDVVELSPAQGLEPEVYAGELVCEACGAAYPVRDFIPDLRPEGVALQEATVRHYSSLWLRNGKKPAQGAPRRASKPRERVKRSHPHAAVVADILPLSPGEGSLVLDAGCGDGKDLTWLANRCPEAEFVGMDLSEGVLTAERRSAHLPNVSVIRGSVLKPPLRRTSFDLVYSYGVLHHTPNPSAAFAALCSLLRPAGRIAIYVYTDLREEPWLRLGLMPITSLRRFTRRLSPAGLRRVARALSPLIYLTFGIPAKALRSIGQHRRAERLPFNWVSRPQGAYGDLFDRLGAEFEWRHSAPELRGWCERARLHRVSIGKIPDRRGWLVYGERAPEPSLAAGAAT